MRHRHALIHCFIRRMSAIEEDPTVLVKWRGTEYRVEGARTLGELKERVGGLTGVDAKRQKLMGLPPKAAKGAPDVATLLSLGVKAGQRLMMLGSPEAEHDEHALAAREALATQAGVLDDLADLDEATGLEAVENSAVYLDKIAARVRTYSPKVLAGPRPGKKCLVLDVDYTLFDHRSPAESAAELRRPFLLEFLSGAYEHYDLVIWSATSMSWIELKMAELGVLAPQNSFRLAMLLDAGAMIGVSSPAHGPINVKPLGVLWGLFGGHYSAQNTIMLDDLSRNFLMNPRSGLKIRPCRGMTIAANRDADVELLGLGAYLAVIKDELDLSALDHRRWERAVRRRRGVPLRVGSGGEGAPAAADEVEPESA